MGRASENETAMELNSYGSGKNRRDNQPDSSIGPIHAKTKLLALLAGMALVASTGSVMLRRRGGDAVATLYSDVSSYGSSNSFPWNTYKVCDRHLVYFRFLN